VRRSQHSTKDARAGGSALGGVKALIFDFDGTIAAVPHDFDAMRRDVVRAAARCGVEGRRFKRLRIIEAIEYVAAILGPGGEGFRAQAAASTRRREIEAARKGRLIPGAMAALKRLRTAGFSIAVITRNCEEAVAITMRGRELPCDILLTRDHVKRVKPHPQHLRRALSRLNARPGQSIMVGDHPIDIEAGKALKMRTVGVLTGSAGRKQLEQAGADLIVPNVGALARMLLMGFCPQGRMRAR